MKYWNGAIEATAKMEDKEVIKDDSESHNHNLQAVLTNDIASCSIPSDEEYVEGFCDQLKLYTLYRIDSVFRFKERIQLLLVQDHEWCSFIREA
nr:hypothetical protein [Tanacetum cinerariifolium]